MKFNKREYYNFLEIVNFQAICSHCVYRLLCQTVKVSYKQTALRQILRTFCVWQFHMVKMLHSLCKCRLIEKLLCFERINGGLIPLLLKYDE